MGQTVQRYFDVVLQDCDAKNTYDFAITNNATVGVLEKFSFPISGKELVADTEVRNPETPDAKLPVSVVLNRIRWDGGATDPIELWGRITPKNRGIMWEALSVKTGGSDVSFSGEVFAWDRNAKKYFKVFTTDGNELKCVITQGTKANIEQQPDMIVQQPVNYEFYISLTPKSEAGEQMISIAASAENKFTLAFGVKA